MNAAIEITKRVSELEEGLSRANPGDVRDLSYRAGLLFAYRDALTLIADEENSR